MTLNRSQIGWEPKTYGWEILWEEEAGIRAPGAYADWTRLIDERNRLVTDSEFLFWETSDVETASFAEPIHDRAESLEHPRIFAPKSSESYIARVGSATQVRQRRHEDLLRQYGLWISEQGFVASTNWHPIDLIIEASDHAWIVEAKITSGSRWFEQARTAIGQLLEYRHFYGFDENTGLVALFNRAVPIWYVEFLTKVNIVNVWRDSGTWCGSSGAVALGFAERTV